MNCAAGPFPAAELHLVTWNDDPYVQDEEGDLFTLCPKCRKEEEEQYFEEADE